MTSSFEPIAPGSDIPLERWSDFDIALQRLEQTKYQLQGNEIGGSLQPMLYRGQADATWPLKSTLDRASNGPVLLTQYYLSLLRARPQTEAFGGQRWDLDDFEAFAKWAHARKDLAVVGRYPGYEFMAYLRHHGFPSPLLDWTRSPYIAAFFAFRKAQPGAARVAIYCYLQSTTHGLVWDRDEPVIGVTGPYARTHKRHFLQQCDYTVCTNGVLGLDLAYVEHEQVVARRKTQQDLFWRITIPATERHLVLDDLDRVNINAFSLMASEDALAETLARREFRFV